MTTAEAGLIEYGHRPKWRTGGRHGRSRGPLHLPDGPGRAARSSQGRRWPYGGRTPDAPGTVSGQRPAGSRRRASGGYNVVMVLGMNNPNATARKSTRSLHRSGLGAGDSSASGGSVVGLPRPGDGTAVPPAGGLEQAPGPSGIHGAGGIGGLLAVEETAAGGSSSHSYWFFYDANGNVGQLIRASDRSLAAHYEYDPYGNTIVATGPYGGVLARANPFRFSTKHYDAELDAPGSPAAEGLYYYGYRYYTPRLGRWLSRDPAGSDASGNLFAFCWWNASSQWVDPLGKE